LPKLNATGYIGTYRSIFATLIMRKNTKVKWLV